MSWPTAAELAKEVHLSAGAVRKYLTEMVVDGTVERRADDSVSNPTGLGAFRFNVRDVPLGPVRATDDLLCKSCAVREFGDELRYEHARTRSEGQLTADLDERDYERYVEEARCGRCGRSRFG